MSFFGLFGSQQAETRSLNNPNVSLSDNAAWEAAFGALSSSAGETVNHETAMQVPAIAAAINVISQTIASLPLHYFKRTDDGQRVKASTDPLYRIVHDVVNADGWTSHDWRKWAITCLLTTGRSLTFVEGIQKTGRCTGLWPLDPTRTTISVTETGKVYQLRQRDGKVLKYRASEVIDLVWKPGLDGVSHIDPIRQNREVIGQMLAASKAAGQYFSSGGVPPLVLTAPPQSPQAAERASEHFSAALRATKGRNIIVAPAGHDLKALGFEPQKSQLLETRQWLITEAARIWNIPPTFLQDHSKSTFSNVESLDLAFAKHTILPLVTMIEAELNAKLFQGWNNVIEFSLDGLQRGSFETRTRGYQTLVNSGVMTPAEARALENLPVRDEADVLLVQGAMVPISDAGKAFKAPAPTPQPETEDPETGEETDV